MATISGQSVEVKESDSNKPTPRHKFLIHAKGDHVGVVTTPIDKGESVIGIHTVDGTEMSIKANDAIPLGHKISLVDLEKDQPVIKYGIQIGLTTQVWQVGDYVHTHNIKSARW